MNEILYKLRQFVRKYYMYLLIRNIIYFTIISLISIFFFVIAEYNLWATSQIRKLFFWSMVILMVLYGIYYLFLPFLSVWKYNKRIESYDAAEIIGTYFPEISDKLLNYLQLRELVSYSHEFNLLLLKAIEQKEKYLSPFRFVDAIDKRPLKKSLLTFIVIVIIFSSISVVTPSVTIDSLHRILNYNQHFSKPAPFEFVLLNKSLEGKQDDPYTLKLKIEGKTKPQNANVVIDGKTYLMKKIDNNIFIHEIQRLTNNVEFYFEALGYYSKSYEINVLKKPKIYKIITKLVYPDYLAKETETKENETDFILPSGTYVYCKLIGENIDQIEEINQKVKIEKQKQSGYFNVKVNSSTEYSFILKSKNAQLFDTIKFYFNVIPDLFPKIKVEPIVDTLLFTNYYFLGEIEDDYGFTDLGFAYKKSADQKFNIISIDCIKNLTIQQFYFMFDFSQVEDWQNEEIEYYFFVKDNDALNNYKTTKSSIYTFRMPNIYEVKEKQKQMSDSLQKNISNVLHKASYLQQEAQQIRFNLLNKKSLSWDEQQRIKNFLEEKRIIEEMMKQMIREHENINLLDQLMQEMSQEFYEKQRQLIELMNNLLDEETIKLFQKLEELLDEMKKENIIDYMNQIQDKTQDLQKMLENNLQLYKQLDFEKRMNDLLRNLEELSEQLFDLSNKTQEQKNNYDIIKEHQQIFEKYNELEKSLNQLEKFNEELSSPINFPDELDSLNNEILKNLNNAQENISRGKNNRASEQQRKASTMMKNMKNLLENAMNVAEQENLGEDIENLKRILKNLIIISQQQEQNMNFAKNINTRDPAYTKYLAEQKRIENRYQIVKDSLIELGKRQIPVQKIIQHHLLNINNHLSKVDEYMKIGAIQASQTNQQYVMKSLNDLALLLLEALDQMNQQMMQQAAGKCGKNSQCKGSKPGDKPSIKTMKQLQDHLNKAIEEMHKQMQQGKNKDGNHMSESLMRMAIQQEMIRKMMEDYAKHLQSQGLRKDANILQQIMNQMEQTERDLVNKQLTQTTINRQKEIMVRLMESEKAELERENDDKRTSKTGKVFNNRNPEDIFQYKKEKNYTNEIIKTSPFMYTNYYKQRIAKFYKTINQ